MYKDVVMSCMAAFIHVCVCVCVYVCMRAHMHARLVTHLCQTVCNPVDCSPPGSNIHGILQARYCSRLLFLSPGDLPDTDRTRVSGIAGSFLNI